MNTLTFSSPGATAFASNQTSFTLSSQQPLIAHFAQVSSHSFAPFVEGVRSLTVSLALPNEKHRRVVHVSAKLFTRTVSPVDVCLFVQRNVLLFDGRLSFDCSLANIQVPAREEDAPLQLTRAATLSMNSDYFLYFYAALHENHTAKSVPFDRVFNMVSAPFAMPECSGFGDTEQEMNASRFLRGTLRLVHTHDGFSFRWKKTALIASPGAIHCNLDSLGDGAKVVTVSKDPESKHSKLLKTVRVHSRQKMHNQNDETHPKTESVFRIQSNESILQQAKPPFYITTKLSPSAGFHPSMHVSVTTSFKNELAWAPSAIKALILHLPVNHHAFVDPFQVSGLNRVYEDGNVQFLAYGEPDLEVPASDFRNAKNNGVFVVVKDVSRFIAAGTRTIEIPFHMRYQPPSMNETYVLVPVNPISAHIVVDSEKSFYVPETSSLATSGLLFAVLKEMQLLPHGKRGLSFLPVAVKQEGNEMDSLLSMKMPVGNLRDQTWVLVTMSACVIVVCGYMMSGMLSAYN
ncbi:hypothetical protein HDU80_008738 [Chytriomyces hyalinus]|nr:hypothetical protein HDU80_008738 [Chytriomyces hyalinus]